MGLPDISVVIPTFNRAEELGECLEALAMQDYPRENLEVLIVDGFSTDQTRSVANAYGAKVLDNPKTVHPCGRPIGIREATGEVILCLDSDNILSESDWLRRMVEPFSDERVVATEPLFYSARPEDNIVTKYCALIGGDDPIVVLLGFNERYSFLTGKWTGVPVSEEDRQGWLRVEFSDPNIIPSLGANGFMVRKKVLEKVNFDPFFHIDVSQKIIKLGGKVWGKVKVGLIHKHGVGPAKFIVKKKRRAERRMDRTITMSYSYPISTFDLVIIALKGFLVLPVLYDTFRGWLRKRELTWLFHPVAFYGVLVIYGWTVIRRIVSRPMSNDYEKV